MTSLNYSAFVLINYYAHIAHIKYSVRPKSNKYLSLADPRLDDDKTKKSDLFLSNPVSGVFSEQ